MQIMLKNLAQRYMYMNPQVSIYVDGGGTGTGVKALTEGRVEICAASRLLEPEEARLISSKYNSVGIYTLIAKDALSVFIHPDNPVRDLSLEQLDKIFTGTILNWRDVGGTLAPIQVIIRPPNSGTHLYLKEYILDNKKYTSRAKTLSTTRQITEYVQKNPDAIGYGGIAYGSEKIDCSINGIKPTVENVRNDIYPISRYLYLYTIKKPRGLAREFIDWVLSNEGQEIVRESGYIALRPLE